MCQARVGCLVGWGTRQLANCKRDDAGLLLLVMAPGVALAAIAFKLPLCPASRRVTSPPRHAPQGLLAAARPPRLSPPPLAAACPSPATAACCAACPCPCPCRCSPACSSRPPCWAWCLPGSQTLPGGRPQSASGGAVSYSEAAGVLACMGWRRAATVQHMCSGPAACEGLCCCLRCARHQPTTPRPSHAHMVAMHALLPAHVPQSTVSCIAPHARACLAIV